MWAKRDWPLGTATLRRNTYWEDGSYRLRPPLLGSGHSSEGKCRSTTTLPRAGTRSAHEPRAQGLLRSGLHASGLPALQAGKRAEMLFAHEPRRTDLRHIPLAAATPPGHGARRVPLPPVRCNRGPHSAPGSGAERSTRPRGGERLHDSLPALPRTKRPAPVGLRLYGRSQVNGG
jgi:hypothetical protein